jgi:hypothetical protein
LLQTNIEGPADPAFLRALLSPVALTARGLRNGVRRTPRLRRPGIAPILVLESLPQSLHLQNQRRSLWTDRVAAQRPGPA